MVQHFVRGRAGPQGQRYKQGQYRGYTDHQPELRQRWLPEFRQPGAPIASGVLLRRLLDSFLSHGSISLIQR